ncbi:B2 bradykinin receptor-like [Salarias fasciatus]|uniref:B2 bradykinin receptor-like n=1 Tax=Salarias fasciatus TaxID=181472 RepID=UPI001176ED40|nr:B2 bradykinin receptor-like [Salarias fasciatus]
MTALPTSDPGNFSSNETTNNSSCQYNDPIIFTVLPVYVMVISVLGIIMNVFVLLVFWLHKKACTVAEIYLCNLAAADLLLAAFLPFWAKNIANQYNWPFNDHLCKVVNAAIFMNVHSSIYFLVMISIDRYLALVHPLSHQSLRRPRTAKLVCFVVWSLALVLTCPMIIYREVLHSPQKTICVFNIPHSLLYNGIMIILNFIIPTGFILYFTVKILKALGNRLSTKMISNSQAQEQKATTLVLSVLLAFLICWVPYHVIKIITMFVNLYEVGGCQFVINLSICRNIFTYFAFFNSVLNPILYVIVGKKFQKKAKELFTLRCDNKYPVTFSLISQRQSRSDTTRVTPD